VSNEAVGVVLAGVAVFFGLLGYLLSRAGLNKVERAAASVAANPAALGDQLKGVNDALAGLTGRQAPARVAWSLSLLCLVAAFVAFGLISVSLTPGDD
jgi:hypothetical protein